MCEAGSSRQIPRRTTTTAPTTVPKRKFPYTIFPRRAAILCNTLLLLLVISWASTTTSFVGASTLPFGTIRTTSRKQTTAVREPNTALSRNSAFHRRLFDTRAGSTTAGFVGTAGLGLEPLSYYLKVALAGGVAGATGSALLYPLDSAKTLRQSDPGTYSSVKDALLTMLRSKHAIQRVYRGILPAALGAIPSSALYFGTYESSKVVLQRFVVAQQIKRGSGSGSTKHHDHDLSTRFFVHGLAAASGNVLSSFVFVPKEVIKQQLQIRSGEGAAKATIASIVRQKGIIGLYTGYGATLLRNIPSATIRFVLYEELKRKWATTAPGDDERTQKFRAAGTFLAGAVAGSTSSFIMTPIDVVKTRMATGSCPLGVKSCMLHVVKEAGWKGLYAGAGSRVLWSGAFSAIGFATFEMVKGYLGVSSSSLAMSSSATNKEGSLPLLSNASRRTATSMTTRTFAKARTTATTR